MTKQINSGTIRETAWHPAYSPTCGLVWSQVHDVHIGAEPDVVGQVPAVVVRIFVDHDIVAIPKPVAAIANVEGGNTETKTAKPEKVRASAPEMPHMAATEAARKVPMLPGVIEMIVNVAAAGVVSDPFAVVMDVGSVGMPRFVVEVRRGLRRMRRASRSGTVRRDVGNPTTNTVNRSVLSKGREREQNARRQQSDQLFLHQFLQTPLFRLFYTRWLVLVLCLGSLLHPSRNSAEALGLVW